ncbi:MAG TPA: PIG-L family deacetylase [Thermoanaerobaculia bacterium]|nr:PIG-L family deacetylase [Thermoanaerobaculia bacterium]
MRKLLVVLCLLFALGAQAKDAAELQLALRKLTVVGSALYIAAHPDDENTAMLSYWASDRLYRSGYLSMTRGDGGQNLIGDEKGELLGVIRTQELLAARRIDGAEQFFTRALDFGFSKNPEETLTIWNRNDVLADVVWVIRKFQPDVIVTRFPTTGEGGHGHHTASAILANEAFVAAGDPTRFPEQLKYVNVWKPKRIYWNQFNFRGPVDPNAPEFASSLRVDLGTYNPLLGRAYTEIAAESRSQHKSQGFGSAERRGSIINYYKLTGGEPASKELFEGIDTSWSRYPGGDAVGKILQQAADSFDPKNPSASIPLLLQASDLLDRLGAGDAWSPRVNPWIDVKRAELLEAIRMCAGIAIDVAASDSSVIAGGEIPVSITVTNRSDYPFVLSTVASPYGNPSKAPGAKLENNKSVKTDIAIKLPADYDLSQPYWLRQPPSKGMFNVTDQQLIGRAQNPPSIPITVSIADNQMHTLIFTVPAVFRRTDPVRGEITRAVDVVPEVVANLGEHVYLFPDNKPRDVAVKLMSFAGATDATVRLRAPQGWKVAPESQAIAFKAKGDEAEARFTVTPTASESNGRVVAEVTLPSGKKLEYALTNIDYAHIPAQRLFNTAAASVIRIDLKKRGTNIGYIMGSGDDVPNVLRQAGYVVTLLNDAELDRGDFAKYDAIVAGIRAYNTRTRLKLAHAKLMKYVENGGTYVVQYNTNGDDLLVEAPGPYPFKLSRDRVTVEEAPVAMIKPDHPLLTTPNRITAADFNGWVQERGLYYTAEADPRYEKMLESHDPGETPKDGGQLYAHVGKGAFVYTSYSWWRQLAAGVPGAMKMFVNLVSAK